LGTAPGGFGLPDSEAIDLIHAALDLGVTYLDTAPGYDRAQKQLGEVMKHRRDEAFLVSKAFAAEGKKALEILEQSLKDLQTDQVDLVFVHSVGSQDVDQILASDGSLAALREAQKRGLTRYVGFTCHNKPHHAAKILREVDVDAVMFAMNFVDQHTYNFEGDVLPLAAEQDAGVAAMKVFGGAPEVEYKTPTQSILAATGDYDHDLALRYALSLPGVTLSVVGMYTQEELRQNVEWARNYRPLDPIDSERLSATGAEIAQK
jgi:hypothetical protein